MISHEDRAREVEDSKMDVTEWLAKVLDVHIGVVGRDEPFDALLDKLAGCLLPEGSVAVDREKLRVILETDHEGGAFGILECAWESCTWRDQDPNGRVHTNDCPLGGDDA